MNNKVIIIGGGCAGLTAAIYCARAELSPILFAGDFCDKGGLLVKTSIVENYPGYPDGILGAELIRNMESQAIKYGTKIVDKDIISINFTQKPFTVTDSDGEIHGAISIIIATGSKPNKLNLPNESKLWGNGISSCAVCDGGLYKNKKIVVVGGGDSALEEALYLTKFSTVILIHRRNTFRASSIMQKRLFTNPKISIIYDVEITQLIGTRFLEAVLIKNLKTDLETELKVDGLFYGLGLTPNTSLFKDVLQTDTEGYILKFSETQTSIPGIFVAGDASDKIYRQAVVAAGDGCKAAIDANKFIHH